MAWAGRVTNFMGEWVPVVVTNQDAQITVGGHRYDFSCADVPWSTQKSLGNENFYRFETRQGYRAPFDQSGDRPYLRGELNGKEYYSGTIWAAFDVVIEDVSRLELSTDTDSSHMIFQIKAQAFTGNPDPGAPIFRIDAYRDMIAVAMSGTATSPPPIPFTTTVRQAEDVPPVSGSFERFVVKVVPGPTGNGTIDVWRNGVHIVAKTGLTIGYVGYTYYVKFGTYAHSSITTPMVLCYANMDQGADLASRLVSPPPLPGRFPSRAAPAGGNLFVNGDFSTGMLPWTERPTGGTAAVVGGRLRTTRAGGAVGRARYVMNGLTIGAQYLLSCDRFNGTNFGSRLLVSVDPTNATAGAIVDSNITSDFPGWAVLFIATQTTHYINCQNRSGGTPADGQYCEFANFAMVAA